MCLKFLRACIGPMVIGLGLLAPLSSQAAACKISPVEMPVTMVGGRAIVTVTINDVDVPLAVDSGAFFSSFTDAAAEQLHLPVTYMPFGARVEGVTGPIRARRTTVKHLKLLKGEIPNVDFMVGGNEIGGGAMGLLGRNLLAFTDAEYDLGHGVIRLMFPEGDCSETGMAYWANGTPVVELPLMDGGRDKVPPIKAAAKLNDKTIDIIFDTGASSIVSLKAARRAGIVKADMKPDGPIHGMGLDAADSWIARFQKFQLGGETVSDFQLHVGDFDQDSFDMLLGVDFFLSHRIYVSKSQRRMYFTYNGGTIFPLDRQIIGATAADATTPAAAADAPQLDADGYARRGAAAAARGDFASAVADLDRACALAPQVADYFVRRGVVREAMGQRSQALLDFDTALRLEPGQSEALMRRASIRTKSRNRDGALRDLQLLDKQLATQADQRLEMAELYWGLESLDLAVSQWSFWIASHPNDIQRDNALYYRCWARMLLNVELGKAFDDCDEALDHQAKNANYLQGRAWVRLRRDELKKALADFDRSIRIKSDSAWALYGRGIARRKTGDIEQGNADLEAARKLQSDIDAKARRFGLAADPEPLPAEKVAADPALGAIDSK